MSDEAYTGQLLQDIATLTQQVEGQARQLEDKDDAIEWLTKLVGKHVQQVERLEETLKRIRAEVGKGAPDVVEANFMLGRIGQHVDLALNAMEGE